MPEPYENNVWIYCGGKNDYKTSIKNGLKSVISIFLCSVSVVNINLHFQTFILRLIVIIKWNFCLHKESDNTDI